MEAFPQPQALLNSGYSISVALADIIKLFMKILTRLSRVMDWYNKHLVRKRSPLQPWIL